MRNPLRWVLAWCRRGRGEGAQEKGVEAAAPSSGEEQAAGERGAERRLLEALCAELRAAEARREEARWREREEQVALLAELREATGRLQAVILGRLEHVEAEVERLREAASHQLSALEERLGFVAHSAAELRGALGELEQGLGRVSDAFDRQLASADRALRALEEANDRSLEELRASHRAHAESLERSREELLQVTATSRSRLGRAVEEVADFLERQTWPAVPFPEAPELSASPGAAPGWRHPLRAARHRLLRLGRRREVLRALEKRNSELEDLLRERWEENVRRGRALRRALDEETQLLDSLAAAGLAGPVWESEVAGAVPPWSVPGTEGRNGARPVRETLQIV